MLISLYRAIGRAALPFVVGRLARGHETGLDERKGRYAPEKTETMRAASPSIWIHAVSVGEVHAASPIVHAARAEQDCGIVVSTVTVTGAHNARRLIGDEMTAHIYAPWDFAPYVSRACDAVRPSIYAAVETEVWPALLDELRRRGVPRVLVNARVSDRAWRRRGRYGSLYRAGYALFDAILARSDEDASRLAAFGVGDRVVAAGDAKVDAMTAQRASAEQESARLSGLLSHDGAPCVVAGSTHEGEDEVVLNAFARLRAHMSTARLIIVPRHPERAISVLSLARASFDAELFSEVEARRARAGDVVVVDRVGVLFALYGVASCAFIGGSLVPKGGQNVLEPASWGVPVAHGPSMEDFSAPTRELDASGASAVVHDAGELAEFWRRSIETPRREHEAPAYFERNAGASVRIWRAMSDIMARSGREEVRGR